MRSHFPHCPHTVPTPFTNTQGEELDHHDAKAARDEARVPLLEAAVVKGIKKTGMVYSPGKSWAAGLLLVAFSIVIMVTTVVTTFMH